MNSVNDKAWFTLSNKVKPSYTTTYIGYYQTSISSAIIPMTLQIHKDVGIRCANSSENNNITSITTSSFITLTVVYIV